MLVAALAGLLLAAGVVIGVAKVARVRNVIGALDKGRKR